MWYSSKGETGMSLCRASRDVVETIYGISMIGEAAIVGIGVIVGVGMLIVSCFGVGASGSSGR